MVWLPLLLSFKGGGDNLNHNKGILLQIEGPFSVKALKLNQLEPVLIKRSPPLLETWP